MPIKNYAHYISKIVNQTIHIHTSDVNATYRYMHIAHLFGYLQHLLAHQVSRNNVTVIIADTTDLNMSVTSERLVDKDDKSEESGSTPQPKNHSTDSMYIISSL